MHAKARTVATFLKLLSCRTGHYSPTMSYGCVVDVCEIGRSEDAWYKSLHAIELDQFDITDDATDWGLGRPFVMDMRESLASSVHIKREFPSDAVMEDVGYETSEDVAMPLLSLLASSQDAVSTRQC